MFDHVTIRVSDRAASERFYRTVLPTLGIEPTFGDERFIEWDDFSLAAASDSQQRGAGVPQPLRRCRGF